MSGLWQVAGTYWRAARAGSHRLSGPPGHRGAGCWAGPESAPALEPHPARKHGDSQATHLQLASNLRLPSPHNIAFPTWKPASRLHHTLQPSRRIPQRVAPLNRTAVTQAQWLSSQGNRGVKDQAWKTDLELRQEPCSSVWDDNADLWETAKIAVCMQKRSKHLPSPHAKKLSASRV